MARLLKQSTAFTFRIGPFLDSTDGVTAETALSIAQADIQISKNGGAFAQTSATPTTTHDADGWYQCPLTATDTGTLGPLTVQIVMSGALPVWEHFMVVPANVYDSLVGGSDTLQADVTQVSGSAVSTTTAQLGVNVVQVSGDATAANNLEADYDGTGYNKSNSTIGTTTTNTDMVAAAPTAAAVADAVWDEAKSGHVAAGSFGEEVQSHSTLTAANVNSEVVDVLKTDTIAQLSQGAPPTTPTFEEAVMYLYSALAFKAQVDGSANEKKFFNQGGTAIWKKALTDASSIYTEANGATGP